MHIHTCSITLPEIPTSLYHLLRIPTIHPNFPLERTKIMSYSSPPLP